MSQLDPSRYVKATAGTVYGESYGIYWDKTNSQLVLVIAGSIVARADSSGITADIEVANNVRGDLLRRGTSALERFAAKASGQVVMGDGTDVVSLPLTGDVTLSGAGVTAVTNITQASQAAGDLIYKATASTLTRLAKGSSGHVLKSDGSVPSWGFVASANVDPQLIQYVKVTATSPQMLAINGTPKTVVAAPGAGFTTIIHKAMLVLNYGTVAYANNGILGLYETNAAGTLLTGTLTLASFLAQTADTIKELHPTAASATTGLTRLDNKAVVLTQATGESINGDSPVDVHCWYSTVPHGL